MLRVRSYKKTFKAGPFQFVRLVEIRLIGGRQFVAGGPVVGIVGGVDTCAKCGAKLRLSYVVQDSDGRRFAVGSSCLRKLGLTHHSIEEVRRAEQEMKQRRRDAREKLQAARLLEMSGTWFRDPFRELP